MILFVQRTFEAVEGSEVEAKANYEKNVMIL